MRLLKAEQKQSQDEVQPASESLHERIPAVLQKTQAGSQPIVSYGKHRQAKRAHQKRERIEPSNDSGAEHSGSETSDQQVVLERLPALVTIRFNQLFAALALRFPAAEKVMDRTERTDPSAKEPAQEHRGDEDHQAPEQSAIERMTSQNIGERDERVDLKEERNRIWQMDFRAGCGQRTAEFRAQKKKEKKQEE